MKKNLVLLLSVFTLFGLTACESESYHTSETNVEFTTTTEGSESKYDTEAYNMSYHIDEEGTLILYVPETDTDYWRFLTFDEAENTMEFVADEVDEDGIYYMELQPTITDGTAQAIVGHFTPDDDENAIDYAIVDVSVEGGKAIDIVDSGFTDSLEGILE